ncbi:MAG: hypothetical protein JO015_20675 [Verrucomicrobia bacterium]|nr:hypothetical protein [Verrucomicrobiota bacterium]
MGAERRREHFGTGALSLNPATSVFLNCPYDLEYRSNFDAAVLTVICCGFMPRCALESGTVAEHRMDRIIGPIFESKYSIHDRSRCKGEGDANLARFNMPLELGIAMARRHQMRRKAQRHDWLAIVPAEHEYARFISDVAGFDLMRYDGSKEGLVSAIMPSLATRWEAKGTLKSEHVLKALPGFEQEMRTLREEWRNQPPWADIVLAALEIVKRIA